jgi:cystathionine beta-lyase/cystathionine gamma-synthase
MPDRSPRRLPSLGESTPLVPPLYQSSVYTLPDLDALDRIMNAEEPGFIYARDAHPNARHLGELLAQLEGAAWGVVCGSGMAAISAILLATIEQNQRIVASKWLYGRTLHLLQRELERFGVATHFVDACNLDEVRDALAEETQVLFVETMSNPLLRLVDVAGLAKLARERDCLLIVDNTFATPVLTKPLDLGADVVMESLTKMIAGHSDVTLGVVCGQDKDLLVQTNEEVSVWGLASNPFDCWLAERGLATLSLRMRTASHNAAVLADWLVEQPGVSRVVYPGRPDHPDHELAKRLLTGGFGNMLCFELEGGRASVNRLLRHGAIPFSPSLGNTTTTLSHPATTSHRYVSPGERKRQGITDGLVRLSVGVEDVDLIQQEIRRGLE